MFQGQRKPAQLAGDLPGDVLREVGDAGAQQRDRFGQVDDIQLQDLAQGGEPAAAGGDDHMAGDPRQVTARRAASPDVFDLVGVVEDQQPARHPAQLIMNLRPQAVRVRCRVQAESAGQGGELVRDGRRFFRGDPVHQVIVPGVQVAVLGGQLGLADPAHPPQRLHRHPRTTRQRLGQDLPVRRRGR